MTPANVFQVAPMALVKNRPTEDTTSRGHSFSLFIRYHDCVAKWCTVTTTDSDGKRYSLDVQAESSYDAAHLYLCHAKNIPGCGFPVATTSTTFEVVANGKILSVSGARLRKWIDHRRSEWKGPRGLLFKQRPAIGD